MSVKHMREIERKNILIDKLHNEIERLKHANRTVSSMVSAEHYQELLADRQALSDRLTVLESRLSVPKGVINFVAACLEIAKDNGGLDGADLQEWLEDGGLIEPYQAKQACDEVNCVCAEWDDFPQTCYRLTDTAIEIIDRSLEREDGKEA